MTEVLVLAGRHAREILRSPASRLGAALLALAGAAALAIPSGRGAADTSAILLASLLVLAGLATAASAGTSLPSDRGSGREEWIASLAPSAASRRLAVVLAWCAVLAAALPLAALLAGAGGALAGRLPAVRESRRLSIPPRARLRAPAEGARSEPIVLRLEGAGDEVEVHTRLLLTGRAAAGSATLVEMSRALVAWRALRGGTEVASGEAETGPTFPLRLAIPPEADSLSIENRATLAHVRLLEAYRLGVERSVVGSLVVASLVVVLIAFGFVAVGVLVSRLTSAPTAVAATLAVTLLGVLGLHLDDLKPVSAHVAERRTEPPDPAVEAAWNMLKGASYLAPDLRALSAIEAPSRGRAIGWDALRATGPAVLYALVAALAVAVPGPRTRRP